jgi:hypothetical protein
VGPVRNHNSPTTTRNGSTTAVGIILGFSLSFITRWGANPVPWQVVDLFAVVSLLGGIAFQIWAFAVLLKPESIPLDIFKLSAPDMLR